MRGLLSSGASRNLPDHTSATGMSNPMNQQGTGLHTAATAANGMKYSYTLQLWGVGPITGAGSIYFRRQDGPPRNDLLVSRSVRSR